MTDDEIRLARIAIEAADAESIDLHRPIDGPFYPENESAAFWYKVRDNDGLAIAAFRQEEYADFYVAALKGWAEALSTIEELKAKLGKYEDTELPGCFVPGCTNKADPRFFVRDNEGKLREACDAHPGPIEWKAKS